MNVKEFNIEKVYFPRNAERVDYFKAAVLYIIKDGAIRFEECSDEMQSTLEEPQVKAVMKQAVPGNNSTLLNLEIMCNVNDHIIKSEKLDLRRKISTIASSIEKYVVV